MSVIYSREVLETLKVPELKAKAKELKVKGFSKLKKTELVEALLAHFNSHNVNLQTSLPVNQSINPHDAQVAIAPPSQDEPAPASRSSQPTVALTSQDHEATSLITELVSASSASLSSVTAPTAAKASGKRKAGATSAKPKRAKVKVGASKTIPGCVSVDQAALLEVTVQTAPQAAVSFQASTIAMRKKPLAKKTAASPRPFVPLKRIVPVEVVSRDSARAPDISPPQVDQESLSTEGLIRKHKDLIQSSWIENLVRALHSTRVNPVFQGPWPTPIPLPSTTRELAFQGLHPRLYSSSTRVFTVALRFWTSRLHTQLAIDSCGGNGSGRPDLYGPDITMWPVIVGCEELSNEIWLIETQGLMQGSERVKRPLAASSSNTSRSLSMARSLSMRGEDTTPWIKTESFLVLASTGEVIGRSLVGSSQQQDLVANCQVREDFLNYMTPIVEAESRIEATPDNFLLARLHSHAKSSTAIIIQLPSISSFVKTKDSHSFPQGISRHWQDQMRGRVGQEEALRVAERAVISSCMLNGISGSYENLAQQEASWVSSSVSQHMRVTAERLTLFLPESHQVLSVHLSLPPNHPELAFVARSSGVTDIVIRSTGQCVGVEDYEGVLPVWRGILSCDAAGKVVEDLSAEFWEGWEDRA